MTTGERIKKCRKERGLTQKQLGELCGIAEANIRKYELGKANPKIETVSKIAFALGIHIYDLMGERCFNGIDFELIKANKDLVTALGLKYNLTEDKARDLLVQILSSKDILDEILLQADMLLVNPDGSPR